MKSQLNYKISSGAISYFLNLEAQNEKEYNINYILQVQKIYICKPSIQSGNEKVFYSCTLCDNEYKYSGFIIGRNLVDREPSPGDIIQITKIGVCFLSKKSKKVILIKEYECIFQKTEIIKNVKSADNLLLNFQKNIVNEKNKDNVPNENEGKINDIDNNINKNIINSSQSNKNTISDNSQNSNDINIKNLEQIISSPEKTPKIIKNNIFNLSDISTYSKNIIIYVKVIKKCEIKTFINRITKKESKVLSFDIIDSKGFEMQANIYDNGLEKLNNILKVGEIYYIIGGYAKLSDKKYTKIKSDYKLIFDSNTQIYHIDKKDDTLFPKKPQEKNGLVRFADLLKYPVNSIIDCLAYVLESSSKTIKYSKNGNSIAIKKILVGDSSGIKCHMTLWKKFTEIPIEKGNILLLKYIRVGEYNGICLTTIDDSNIIINPTEKFKELDNLKAIINSGVDENYFKFLKKEDHINQEIINKQQNQNPILENEKLDYISDLLNNLKDGSNYSANFNIKATVFEIYHSIKNYYCGCPNKSCRKKLSKNSEGEWFCQACKEKYIEPYYYYTVSLRIKDLTGEHFVDLFGDSVTTLFGIKAEEYSKLVENNDIEQLNKINDKVEFHNYYFSGKASIQKYNNRIKKQLFVYRFDKEDSEKESFGILNKLKKILQ